jgi:hypothetical protein
MKNKKLMFEISKSLYKPDAISFVKTLPPDDTYYLVKTHENKKEPHIAKRQSFVVVRDLRAGETVVGRWGRMVEQNELISVCCAEWCCYSLGKGA